MLSNDDYSQAFHEIKNAVTLINSSLQLLEHKHPEVRQYSYWNNSLQSLDYLREMLAELSQARLSENVKLKPVNVNLLLHDILLSIQSLKWCGSFECKASIMPGLPTVLADSFRLTQAIINLLKNAYEAMDQTGLCLLNAYHNAHFLYIDIIDHGGGIAPAYEDTIFHPFTTSKPNGTGLGLTICKQVIENHNGKLTYESRPGDGCTFQIILPTT